MGTIQIQKTVALSDGSDDKIKLQQLQNSNKGNTPSTVGQIHRMSEGNEKGYSVVFEPDSGFPLEKNAEVVLQFLEGIGSFDFVILDLLGTLDESVYEAEKIRRKLCVAGLIDLVGINRVVVMTRLDNEFQAREKICPELKDLLQGADVHCPPREDTNRPEYLDKSELISRLITVYESSPQNGLIIDNSNRVVTAASKLGIGGVIQFTGATDFTGEESSDPNVHVVKSFGDIVVKPD